MENDLNLEIITILKKVYYIFIYIYIFKQVQKKIIFIFTIPSCLYIMVIKVTHLFCVCDLISL